jgi:hypothetical protein
MIASGDLHSALYPEARWRRDSELVMRPSFWQTLHARRRLAKGDRTQVVAHEDVLVFRKPLTAATKARAVSTRKAA